MRFAKLSALASAVFVATTGSAYAAGFQIGEHSAGDVGRAFAGTGVVADDASVQAGNAAGLAFVKGTMVSASAAVIDPSIKIKGTYYGPFAGAAGRPANESDMAPTETVPAVFIAQEINDQWAWGFGAYSNFGLVTNYHDDFGALALADKSELKTANLNLNVAYRINPQVAIGFGIDAVKAEAKLSSTIPSPTPIQVAPNTFVDIGGKTIQKLEGDDWGYGWNLGIVAEPMEGTRIGLAYRSEVDLSFEGDVKSDVYNGVGLPQNPLNPHAVNFNSDAKVDVDLPEMITLSFSQVINTDWSVMASVQRIGWDSFDELKYELDNGAPVPATQEQWEDSMRYSLGTTYKFAPEWTLRAGVMFDESPVKDEYRTLRIPDSDRTWYTIGAGWQATENFSVDAAYAYLDADKARLNETGAAGKFVGEVSGDAQIFSLQANYRF